MKPDPETLMAYADGELDDIAAARVARAVAADPALAAEVDAHRALRARLAGGFAPVAAEPVPDRFAALLARPAPVVSLDDRRIRKRGWWPMTGAIAASLVVGLMTGQALRTGGGIDGQAPPVASGPLATALTRQLASDQSGAAVRMIASFRTSDGAYCRVFAAPATSGVACRTGDGWTLRRTAAGAGAQATDYRQAGSGDAAMLAAAQDMMVGDPLDAAGEAAAREAGWR
ncbi:MAG TPA: anti-sigma factor [Sphingomonas sp.]|nr:anti-sigma factor [Sphingomonas sp.]